MIPIIDIFAGPGGLGEGFSSLRDENNEQVFKIKLSIEKDVYAHKTLKLRSFYRHFQSNNVPENYYLFLRGEITLDELYNRHPEEAKFADEEAWCGTLGAPEESDNNGVSDEEVDIRIRQALAGMNDWVLIGGPPCQAYSLVGRSRRQETILSEENDKRVGLYKEYLRILAVHQPSVFVMENVKGILSAQTANENVFAKILEDLSDPVSACISEGNYFEDDDARIRYRIYSLAVEPNRYGEDGYPIFNPRDFIIKAEEYGIPQKRHRVILLGVREDLATENNVLTRQEQISLSSVIGNLPPLRSGLTRSYSHSETRTDNSKKRYYVKENDSAENWMRYVDLFNSEIDAVLPVSERQVGERPSTLGIEFKRLQNFDLEQNHPLAIWYRDQNLQGILHHVSRKHLVQDIKRYLFASRYAYQNGAFPRLSDYKNDLKDLVPDHENVDSGKFTDRFRVQLPDIPATTVTSHISKDGHYFIHYDPLQCRSFTVREAARVQTFPDNYFFCGGRTQQFHQVGNAVPPFLAYQISQIVARIFTYNGIN